MNEKSILAHIQELVEHERELRHRATSEELQDEAQTRLKSIEVELDQAWDLLRQRRALKEFGQDAD